MREPATADVSLVPFSPAAALAAPVAEEPDGGAGRAAALLRAMQRLESVIDEEVEALRERRFVDFDQFSRRKNRGLLELVRSSRAAGDIRKDPAIAARIVGLRGKLRQNYDMLRLHFEAVRAVSEIIGRVIRDAESDGTYPPTAPAKEGR
jgi:hypothetical protein